MSCGEDKTVCVWDLAKRMAIQTFRQEHDKFWILAYYPRNFIKFSCIQDSSFA